MRSHFSLKTVQKKWQPEGVHLRLWLFHRLRFPDMEAFAAAFCRAIEGEYIEDGIDSQLREQRKRPFQLSSRRKRSSAEAQQLTLYEMDQEHACCAEVENKATPTQRKVLQAFAKGLRPQQVAQELIITLATVDIHKTALLTLCHDAWNVPKTERLDYHFLHAKFADYFSPDEMILV
jgi:Bacterial regulatory proteins, luxR family